jgi:hypothetical protein
MRRSIARRRPWALSAGRAALGAASLGALATGALAVGALVVRAMAIRSLAVRTLRAKDVKLARLEVDELFVAGQRIEPAARDLPGIAGEVEVPSPS